MKFTVSSIRHFFNGRYLRNNTPSDSITLPLAHSSSLYFRPDSSSTHRGTSSSGGDHRISPSKSASLGRPSRPRTAPPNRASSKSSRSESAHPVSDTGAIKRQDTVDARKSQQQLSTTSALGKHRIKLNNSHTLAQNTLL